MAGEIEHEQGERAAAWAKAISSLKQWGNAHEKAVLDWIVHEATWFVPLQSKAPPARIFRYISEGIHEMGDLHRLTDFRREHVKPRGRAEAEIHAAATEADVAKILKELKVCAVPKGDHGRLEHGAVDGWDRYRKAGIRVWDCVEEHWLW